MAVDINSGIEKKVKACRNFKAREIAGAKAFIDENGKTHVLVAEKDVPNPAAWAFKHEGEWYCFMENVRAPCATEDSRIITRKLYSADEGLVEVTAEYHVCGIRGR